MSTAYERQPSPKSEAFLASVENSKYDRQIITGLQKFFDGKAPADMRDLYSPVELQTLRELRGTPKDVEKRMPGDEFRSNSWRLTEGTFAEAR